MNPKQWKLSTDESFVLQGADVMPITTTGQWLAAQTEWRRRNEDAFQTTSSFVQDSRIRIDPDSIEVSLTTSTIEMVENTKENAPSPNFIRQLNMRPSDECSDGAVHPAVYNEKVDKQPSKEENAEDGVQHETSFFPLCCERFKELALLTNLDYKESGRKKGAEIVHHTQGGEVPNLGDASDGSVGTDSTCGSMTEVATTVSPMPIKPLAPLVKSAFVAGAHETSIESILFTSPSPHTEMENYFMSEPFLSEKSKDRFRSVLNELREKQETQSQSFDADIETDVVPSMESTQATVETPRGCEGEINAETLLAKVYTTLRLSTHTELAPLVVLLAFVLHLFLRAHSTVSAGSTDAFEDVILTPQWLLIYL